MGKKELKKDDTPQNLFIERCMNFLKPGGRMALVLPDGIFGNDGLGYLRQFMLKKARIIAIIDLPKETFMPHTSTKTSVIILRKYKNDEDKQKKYPLFMAVCETCGHDRRGNIINDEVDDISLVAEAFNEWRNKYGFEF